MNVLIIAGHVEVPSDRRDAFVSRLQDLVERARRAPGRHDIAITADPADPCRVYNYESWESWEHLKAWRAVANAPDIGIPMVADDVQAYEIAVVRPPSDRWLYMALPLLPKPHARVLNDAAGMLVGHKQVRAYCRS